MPSSGYTAITFVAGEQPTTAKWNLIGSNDSSFNTGNGFNDGILVARHFANNAVPGNGIATNAILLGQNQTTTNQSGITTTETTLNFGTLEVTVPAGGRSVALKLLIPNGNSSSGSSDQIRFYWKDNGVLFNTSTFSPGSGFGQEINHEQFISAPSAGAHTYTITVKRVNGPGSFATNASNSASDPCVCVFAAFLI